MQEKNSKDDMLSKLEDLAEVVKDELLPILNQAATSVTDMHQHIQGEGFDQYVYGTALWGITRRLLVNHITNEETAFTVENAAACKIRYKDTKFSFHKVGEHAGENIRTCFPHGAKQAASAVEQLSFDLEISNDVYKENIILGVMANTEEGLCAVYLAVPSKVEDSHIEEWGEVVEVYKNIDIDDSVLQDIGNDLISEEKIDKASVGFNKKKAKKEVNE